VYVSLLLRASPFLSHKQTEEGRGERRKGREPLPSFSLNKRRKKGGEEEGALKAKEEKREREVKESLCVCGVI